MLYIKLFIEREKNTGQSAPECPFKWEDDSGKVVIAESDKDTIQYNTIY